MIVNSTTTRTTQYTLSIVMSEEERDLLLNALGYNISIPEFLLEQGCINREDADKLGNLMQALVENM